MPRIMLRYCCSYTDELIRRLERGKIQYSVTGLSGSAERLVVFSIFEPDMQDKGLEQIVSDTERTYFATLIYGKQEMDSAQWFSMWCDNMKVEDAPDAPAYQYLCRFDDSRARHKEQIRPYTLRKKVNWRASHSFIAALGDSTELFVNTRAKNVLLKQHISGIHFEPVMEYKSRLPFEDMFQLHVINRLPREALIIEEGAHCKRAVCDMCGKVQYEIDGAYQLKVKERFLSPNQDIYTTDRLFGAGFARRQIIISRKLYNVILENKLERTLHFEPIILTSEFMDT